MFGALDNVSRPCANASNVLHYNAVAETSSPFCEQPTLMTDSTLKDVSSVDSTARQQLAANEWSTRRRWQRTFIVQQEDRAALEALVREYKPTATPKEIPRIIRRVLQLAPSLKMVEEMGLMDAPVSTSVCLDIRELGYTSPELVRGAIRAGALKPTTKDSLPWERPVLELSEYLGICECLDVQPIFGYEVDDERSGALDTTLYDAIGEFSPASDYGRRVALKAIKWVATLDAASRRKVFAQAKKALTPVRGEATRTINDLYSRVSELNASAMRAFESLANTFLQSDGRLPRSRRYWDHYPEKALDDAELAADRIEHQLKRLLSRYKPSVFEQAEVDRLVRHQWLIAEIIKSARNIPQE